MDQQRAERKSRLGSVTDIQVRYALMNENTIVRYENMEREADCETLIKFADYFNVSLAYA